jgi:hypothetical protein
MEHTILFTRVGEPETSAIIRLVTYDKVTAAVAFDRFHRGMHRWLTTTTRGKEFIEETMGTFNIGDLMLNDATLRRDPAFERIFKEVGVKFSASRPADHRVSYDRPLCNPPQPLA